MSDRCHGRLTLGKRPSSLQKFPWRIWRVAKQRWTSSSSFICFMFSDAGVQMTACRFLQAHLVKTIFSTACVSVWATVKTHMLDEKCYGSCSSLDTKIWFRFGIRQGRANVLSRRYFDCPKVRVHYFSAFSTRSKFHSAQEKMTVETWFWWGAAKEVLAEGYTNLGIACGRVGDTAKQGEYPRFST